MAKGGMRVITIPRLATRRGMEGAMRTGVRNGLSQVGREVQSDVRIRIKDSRDSRGFRGRVDKGILWNAITAGAPKLTATKATQETFIAPPADERGIMAEDGRRPGRTAPPIAQMASWIRRTDKGRALLDRFQANRESKGLPKLSRANAIKRLAPLLAASIGRKGIPGIGMFAGARKEFGGGRSTRTVRGHIARAYRAARR